MTPSLQQALEALYGFERRRDKLGLDGTRALLAALGDPQRRFRAVHVAGSNGKGSVCALVERVLRAAGHRTGLFTSPHLVDFRERIRVDGRWADEARLAARLEHVQSLPEGRDRTFFEVATALGFDDFAARRVEWAVVEVGLGGRLDCTNVVSPEVTVITRIALDHTEVLGETLAAIAAEKAGILKPGIPAVLEAGEPAAQEVLERAARAAGAPLAPIPERLAGEPPRFRTRTWGEVTLPAPATGFAGPNLGLALAALDALAGRGLAVPRAALAEGVREARWPGRFERCPGEPRLWWDAAHNPDGARALAARWRAAGLPAAGALALAMSRDKDAAAALEALAPIVPARRVVATRSRNARALDPARIAEAAARAGWRATLVADVPAAVTTALSVAGGSPALLTGSLFAVGEAMEAFGGAPGEVL